MSNREFKGPYECPVCDMIVDTTLELAAHNEETGHLNQTPVLNRVPHFVSTHNPSRPKIRRIVRIDLGGGFIIEKEVVE